VKKRSTHNTLTREKFPRLKGIFKKEMWKVALELEYGTLVSNP
jgi:hypothetical protein